MAKANILLTIIGAAVLLGLARAPAPTTSPAADFAEVKQDLARGNSSVRAAAIRVLYANIPSWGKMDDSFVPAFIAAADDPDPKVRTDVARIAAEQFIWRSQSQDRRMIDAMIKMASTDEHPEARYYAIYSGLSTVREKDARVIDGMLRGAMKWEAYSDICGRIAWGLRGQEPEKLTKIFQPYWSDPAKKTEALIAFAIFMDATRSAPPVPKGMEGVGAWGVTFTFLRGRGDEGRTLRESFRAEVPAQLVGEFGVDERTKMGVALVEGVGKAAEVMKRISASKSVALSGPVRPMDAPQIARMRSMIPFASTAPTSAPAFDVKQARAAFAALYEHLGRASRHNLEIKKIDWKAVGDELLPLAEKVKTQREFGLLCLRLVARLRDSHAQLIKGTAEPPAPDFPQFDPGFACLIDDRDLPVVYYVDENGPARRAGVKVGMTVVSVEGVAAPEAMARWMKLVSDFYGYSSERYLRYDAARSFMRVNQRGAITKVEVEDLGGKRQTFEVPAALEGRYLPRLPVSIEGINDSGSVEAKKISDTIGYAYVRRIRGDLPAKLDEAFARFGDIKGVIIDVRGNSGGGFDTNEAFRTFDKYKGPIALLIDERCISAGEGWASWFIANKRARVFGTTTAGASSRKEEYELTNRLYKVIVPVKAYTGFLDRPIESRGLEPDVPVRCNAADLAAGRDTVLETARKWLAEQSP